MARRVAQVLLFQAEIDDRREEARIVRRLIRDAQDPFRLTEAEFQSNFRLKKEACIYVINALAPHLAVGRYRNRIPGHLRVLSVLHFFAVGSYQRSVGNSVWACLSQTMISRAIKEVSNAIIRHLMRRWIRFPRNNAERQLHKNRFSVAYRMREIIGVVDGTHVAIVKPTLNEHVFVNRKGYHSLNVQIVCDAHMKIMSVISRWPGSSHDAYVWRNSIIARTMRANYENGDIETKIMGDSGYPCLPWLLVPLPRPVAAREVAFNNRFKQARSSVERCIGMLKGRFRCLLKHRTLHYSPESAGRIVIACAVLHNIALHYRDNQPPEEYDEIDLDVPAVGPAQHDLVYRQQGQLCRQRYIETYF